MKKITLKYLIGFVLFLASYVSYSQESSSSEIVTDEVQVIKDFEARLANAERVKPEVKQIEIKKKPRYYTYDLAPQRVPLAYPRPYIRPKAMDFPSEKKVRHGYIQGNYGLLNDIDFNLGLHKSIEDYYTIGARLAIDRTNESDINNKLHKHWGANIEASYFITKDLIADVEIGFGRKEFGQFTFNSSVNTEMDTSKISNKYQDISLLSSIKYYPWDELQLTLGLDVNRWSTPGDSLSFQAIKLPFGFRKYFGGHTTFSIGGDFSFNNNEFRNLDKNAYQLNLIPSLSTKIGSAKINIGAQLGTAKDAGKYIIPEAAIRLGLMENQLKIHLSADGYARFNDYASLSLNNPFYDGLVDSLDFQQHINFQLGAKISFVEHLGIKLNLGYTIDKNYPLFVYNQMDFTDFGVIKDDLKNYYIESILEYAILSNLRAKAEIKYVQFNPENELEAWNLPSFRTKIAIESLLLSKKLSIQPSFEYLSGVESRGLSTSDLGRLRLLNLDISLNLTDNFHVFLTGSNLLNDQYAEWSGDNLYARRYSVGARLGF